MVSKSNMKFLKDALNELQIAEDKLNDFVYYEDSDTCSTICSNIHQQIIYLKELIKDLEV